MVPTVPSPDTVLTCTLPLRDERGTKTRISAVSTGDSEPVASTSQAPTDSAGWDEGGSESGRAGWMRTSEGEQ